jgi:hypothetical protein
MWKCSTAVTSDVSYFSTQDTARTVGNEKSIGSNQIILSEALHFKLSRLDCKVVGVHT